MPSISIELISFILGGLLVSVGLLGGGIEIRELKIPPVGQTARVLSVLGGVAFIAIAILGSKTQNDKPSPSPINIPASEKQTFSEPMYGGLRLDACYEWANRCGEEPACKWCKTQGFNHAVDYPTEIVGNRGIHTKLIGTQAECKEPFCASFRYITCER